MKLTFDPLTIEHLGFKMYSHLPNALAELVANAYDADATRVSIELISHPEPSVTVVDDGHGMSKDDLQEKYLRIGRNRVKEGERKSESGKRRVAGKKGLGKLALFGIGIRVTIRTKRRDTTAYQVVELDWNAMLSADGEYEPSSWQEPGDREAHGTSVMISSLKRKTPVNTDSLANSLSRLFNYVDDDFKLSLQSEDNRIMEVTRELRYSSIEKESEWAIPSDLSDSNIDPLMDQLHGRIIASAKPLHQELRGITLYVNGRLANDPEFFGVSESSYAFSYLTGYIDADYLDELSEDVISTDRRSISWELPEPEGLRSALGKLLLEISRRRRESRRKAQKGRVEKTLNIDTGMWVSSIRDRSRADAVSNVLDAVISPDSAMSDSNQSAIVEGLQTIAPEYADLHWRQLHPSIQEACEMEYKDRHYHAAIVEGIKRYVNDVKSLSQINGNEHSIIEGAFADANPKLDVIKQWIDLELSTDTQKNIRTAQRVLSKGLWSGFRDPITHEERVTLEQKGIFTYQDCLDALSILSHLRRRIDTQAQ
ncbi:hypothetical protein K8P10_001372 [Leucobacter sp. Psy1]|nr:hypothetical protein K8P10_001372 [Leucobacter sp. Psy1]